MKGGREVSEPRAEDWGRSERITYGIALTIALLPIPAALLISWALGDPPWRTRPPQPAHQEAGESPTDHGPP